MAWGSFFLGMLAMVLLVGGHCHAVPAYLAFVRRQSWSALIINH